MSDTTTAGDEPTARCPKIEIYPYDVAEGADPEHGFRLRSGNNQIVTHGEGYKDPDAAEAMARKIIIDHAYDNAVVVFLHPDGGTLAEDPAPGRTPVFRPAVIPQAIASEDGDRWWARGHVEPMAMVLAVLVEQATHTDPEQAGRLLVKFTLSGERAPTQADNQAVVAMMANAVVHYWCKPHPDNDDHMLDCEADDEGAEPWTELAL